MKVKKIILMVIFISGTSLSQNYLNIVNYEIGFPVSKMSEFTNKTSFVGFGIDQRKFIDASNSVGFSLGWQIFDEKLETPINVYLENNISGTISGVQLRTVNSFPILISLHHYLGGRKESRTMIGFSAGMYYITQRLDIGIFRFQSNNWHFGISPELGFMIPLEDYNTHLVLVGKYHYAFDSGTSAGGRENNFYSYWNLTIGFAISGLF